SLSRRGFRPRVNDDIKHAGPPPGPRSRLAGEASVQPVGRSAVPVDRLGRRADGRRPKVCEVGERLPSSFTPDTGVAHPAPGRSGVETMVVVDPDHAVGQTPSDPMSARDVPRPHVEPSPNGESFAFSTASSSPATGVTVTTGTKNSSRRPTRPSQAT